MKTRPVLLDFFCGAGGASEGYSRAGFDVVGSDLFNMPNYPYPIFYGDAIGIFDRLLDGWMLTFSDGRELGLDDFDVIVGSPPCQAFTDAQRIQGNDHPDLVTPFRERLLVWGGPYVIENVPGAPLIAPIELCGGMFPELRVYRHRLFESNLPLVAPAHRDHDVRQAKMGRRPKDGEFIQVVGHFSGVNYARAAMGIDWMTRDELSEAIPPAYTHFLGLQVQAYLLTNQTERRAA